MSQPLRIFLTQLGLRDSVHPFTSPPLGLLYLAAYLRDKCPVDIRIVCQEVEKYSNDSLVRSALDFAPDIIGVGCMTPYSQALPDVIAGFRAAMPKAPIILGGPHVSAFGRRAFEMCAADAAVMGEGERSFELYVEAVRNGSGFDQIPGLLWRDAQGNIISNPGDAPIIEDLDSLPMPAYDLIDIRKYWRMQSMPPIPRQRYITLLSSRGCPFGCIWCHNIFGRRFRAHSPERMVDEIMHCVKQYNVNDVEFVDDCFNLQQSRVESFSSLLLKKHGPIKLAFPNALRTDIMNQATVDALADAGMFFTCLALESGVPRIQKMTHKNLDIDKFLAATELITKRRVFTQGFMMLGFPTETEEEMKTTIAVAANSKLHLGSFFLVTPYPNTPLYEYAKSSPLLQDDKAIFSSMDFLKSKINMSAVSDEMLSYYFRKAMRSFYFRGDRILRICRDFPQRRLLYKYLPVFVTRVLKGFLS